MNRGSVRDLPIFSIIMVTYNAENCVAASVQSLLSQTCKNWELRLVDGGSSDRTVDIVNEMVPYNLRLTSKMDRGIYDAMNLGIESSSGAWLFFLNAGDCFFDENVLTRIQDEIECGGQSFDVLYGNIATFDAGILTVTTQYVASSSEFIFNVPICHQSVFYSRKCFVSCGTYDCRFTICADHHHLTKLFRNGFVFRHIDIAVAKYLIGGISHLRLTTLEWERLKIVYDVFGFISCMYFSPKFIYLYLKSLYLKIRESAGGRNRGK